MAKKKSLGAGRRALALVLAFSLVLTMASAPPAGPVGVASATHEECTQTDELLWTFTVGYLNNPLALNQQCDPSALSDHATELEEAMVNATETEIYNTGKQAKVDREQNLAVMDNYIQDSGTVAMAKAEAAAVEAIDAGDSRSEVEAAAVQAVEDYYAKKQMNLVDQWNVQVSTWYSMYNTTQVSDVSDTWLTYNTSGSHDSQASWDGPTYMVGVDKTTTETLVNGTSYITYAAHFSRPHTGGGFYEPDAKVTVSEGVAYAYGGDNDQDTELYVYEIFVPSITDNPSYTLVSFSAYETAWNQITSKEAQIEANAEEYAGSVYNQTQNGTANVSDYVSGATLAQEYATSYNDTGFYSYLVGFAATQGMAIPNLENTSLMTIQTATDTYQGLLMSQNAPSGGVWEVGVTYNTVDIQGKQFVATSDGELVELDGEFSITSMEGPEGQEVQTTESQEFNYTVTNESADYSELQEQLRTLRDEIEDIEPPGGSGGGGDGGLGLDLGLGGTGVLIAAAAAAVLLFGRN